MFEKTDVKERIDYAFYELLSQKPIRRIFVKEITDLAECNRRTYYTYYEDIYDQRKKCQDVFLNEYKELCSRKSGIYDKEIIDFFKRNRQFVRGYLGKYRQYTFLQELIEITIEARHPNLVIDKKDGSEELDIYREFFCSFGSLMSTVFWVGVDSSNVGLENFEKELIKIQLDILDQES